MLCIDNPQQTWLIVLRMVISLIWDILGPSGSLKLKCSQLFSFESGQPGCSTCSIYCVLLHFLNHVIWWHGLIIFSWMTLFKCWDNYEIIDYFCLFLFFLSICVFYPVLTHTHTQTLGIRGYASVHKTGLWGAAGLPVDSHVRSHSLHRNTITQGEGEQALSVECWWRDGTFTRQADRALWNTEVGKEYLKRLSASLGGVLGGLRRIQRAAELRWCGSFGTSLWGHGSFVLANVSVHPHIQRDFLSLWFVLIKSQQLFECREGLTESRFKKFLLSLTGCLFRPIKQTTRVDFESVNEHLQMVSRWNRV